MGLTEDQELCRDHPSDRRPDASEKFYGMVSTAVYHDVVHAGPDSQSGTASQFQVPQGPPLPRSYAPPPPTVNSVAMFQFQEKLKEMDVPLGLVARAAGRG